MNDILAMEQSDEKRIAKKSEWQNNSNVYIVDLDWDRIKWLLNLFNSITSYLISNKILVFKTRSNGGSKTKILFIVIKYHLKYLARIIGQSKLGWSEKRFISFW